MTIDRDKARWIISRSVVLIGAIHVLYMVMMDTQSKSKGLPITDTTSFRGVVTIIDLGRGPKIQVKEDPRTFSISGVCGDTVCLSDYLTWGDTIEKVRGSRTVLVRRNKTVTFWKIDESGHR